MAQVVQAVGDDVHGGAERDVRGLDGGAGGVAHEAHALGPHGVAQALGAEVVDLLVREVVRVVQVAEHGDERERGQQGRTDEGVAQQGATLDLRLVQDLRDHVGRGDAVGLGADLVALLDRLVVGHQGLGPVHDADADAEHGQGGAEAEQQVLQVDLAERLVVADLSDSEVADEEQHGAHDGDEEHDRDLALGALRGLRILIGQTRTVRREARVVDRVPGRVLAGVLEGVRAVPGPFKAFLAHMTCFLYSSDECR